MGTVVSARKFSSENQRGLLKPIIYCCSDQSIVDNAISLNIPMAKKLKKFKPERRTMQLEKCFRQLLNELPENAVIRDFDVLFNPDYRIDVLKMLVNVCKTKPFSVIWPGKLEDGKLIYAEEGYQDYKEYDVADYDVTCVR